MPSVFRYLILLLASAFLLSGCYTKPVRHLASDVVLIKVGESDREEVLTYLGEPDEQEVLAAGVEKWIYKEEEHSALKKAPMVGRYFGAPDYGTVTIVFKGDIVVECLYGEYDHEELDWADDFEWQEK